MAQALPVLSTVLLRVVGFGLPTLVTWLALAADVKRRGRIDSVAWLRADVPALLSTLRTWTPFLVVLSAYAWLDAAVGGKLGPDRDAWMAAADRAIFFGHDPLDLLERLISRPLSEWLAFAYSFYAATRCVRRRVPVHGTTFGARRRWWGWRLLGSTSATR